MPKTAVWNDRDPGIAIILSESVRGYHGQCTQCGWPMHRWNRDSAVASAQRHVDSHAPAMLGGDEDALIR